MRVPVQRDSTATGVVGAKVALIKAGTNVTFSETVVGDKLEVTIAASGGGGGGGTPATTVVSEQSFGQSPAVGTSTDYARGDHTHGTPAVPAHSALSSLAWTSSGHTGTATSVAVFNGGGAAAVSTPSADGQVLSRQGGALVWITLAAGLALYPEVTEVILEEANVLTLGVTLTPNSGTIS
jgi:hypothetical protein